MRYTHNVYSCFGLNFTKIFKKFHINDNVNNNDYHLKNSDVNVTVKLQRLQYPFSNIFLRKTIKAQLSFTYYSVTFQKNNNYIYYSFYPFDSLIYPS